MSGLPLPTKTGDLGASEIARASLLADTTGDVRIAGDDLDRQLERAGTVGLLLDAFM